MWRLVYAPRKLSSTDKSKFLEEHTFTCGSDLSDLHLTDNLSSVCIRDLNCYDFVVKTMKLSAFIVPLQKTWHPTCTHIHSVQSVPKNL